MIIVGFEEAMKMAAGENYRDIYVMQPTAIRYMNIREIHVAVKKGAIFAVMEPQDQREPLEHGKPHIGAKGEPGISGPSDIQWNLNDHLHIAYAESADGLVGFSTDISKSKLYIGTYVDDTEEQSEDPTMYRWEKISGN